MSRTKKRRLTGDAAWEEAFSAVDHAPLLERLGITLTDESLRLALTHRSFANENGGLPNNERLEFLGDAVLGLSVAGQLYDEFPERPESHISKMRASVVSRYGLAAVAREIDLGKHILLGRGELLTDGREKDSILADTTEALLGAIYLEHGFAPAREVILRLFAQKIEQAPVTGIHHDWKTSLQEQLAAMKAPMPVYEAESSGPEHELTFTVKAVVDGRILGLGSGGNKKNAEQEAARQACEMLRAEMEEHTAKQ